MGWRPCEALAAFRAATMPPSPTFKMQLMPPQGPAGTVVGGGVTGGGVYDTPPPPPPTGPEPPDEPEPADLVPGLGAAELETVVVVTPEPPGGTAAFFNVPSPALAVVEVVFDAAWLEEPPELAAHVAPPMNRAAAEMAAAIIHLGERIRLLFFVLSSLSATTSYPRRALGPEPRGEVPAHSSTAQWSLRSS